MSLSEAANRPTLPLLSNPNNGRKSSEGTLSSTPPISPEIEIKIEDSSADMPPNLMAATTANPSTSAAGATAAGQEVTGAAVAGTSTNSDSKKIQNNNTSSYNAGGRLKFFKGKI